MATRKGKRHNTHSPENVTEEIRQESGLEDRGQPQQDSQEERAPGKDGQVGSGPSENLGGGTSRAQVGKSSLHLRTEAGVAGAGGAEGKGQDQVRIRGHGHWEGTVRNLGCVQWSCQVLNAMMSIEHKGRKDVSWLVGLTPLLGGGETFFWAFPGLPPACRHSQGKTRLSRAVPHWGIRDRSWGTRDRSWSGCREPGSPSAWATSSPAVSQRSELRR